MSHIKKLENITDEDDRFAAVVASMTSTSAPSDTFKEMPQQGSVFIVTAEGLFAVDYLASFSPPRLNPAKTGLIEQIDNISEDPEMYEEGEPVPEATTKSDARQLILAMYPSGLLVGATVYAYYGSVNINWQTESKKVKAIIPPHGSGQAPQVYHGIMDRGRVIHSDIERNADAGKLRIWLQWLHG